MNTPNGNSIPGEAETQQLSEKKADNQELREEMMGHLNEGYANYGTNKYELEFGTLLAMQDLLSGEKNKANNA